MKLILALLICGLSWAQGAGDRSTNASINPCPGGGGSAEIDTIPVRSLDRLVRMSDLIVVGSVVNVFPAFSNPQHVELVETDSQISVTQTLLGKTPSGMILLNQLGGKAAPCSLAVPDDRLPKTGEQYVLFLVSDTRKDFPSSSGIPRYGAVAVWSGKAQIVNGKIHFLPRAHDGLHRYDNMDLTTFVATVQEMIGILRKQ